MSKVNELFEKELCVVNFGIESFYQDLKKQNVKAVHVAWKPVAGGDKKIAGYLKQLKDPKLAEKIEAKKDSCSTACFSWNVYCRRSDPGHDKNHHSPCRTSCKVGKYVRSYERRCYGRPDL